jgi:glycosyltransferase involved in cell wall biosynthesis
MACECTIVASNTPPVCEVISDGINGILTDFNSPAKLADHIVRILESPDEFKPLGKAARATVVNDYDFNSVCLPKYLNLIESLLQGHEPMPPCPPPAVNRILFRPAHERLVPINESRTSLDY